MGGLRIVSGRWGGRRLKTPKGRHLRPTSERVREAWMSVLGDQLEGAAVLDLFAGSGALGLEALSRGAAHATFVESSRTVASCLRGNIAALDADSLCDVVVADVFSYLEGVEPGAYDIAFADPPYEGGAAGRLLCRFRESHFAQILSLEHRAAETLDLPPAATARRYGDTAIAFIPASFLEEER